LEKEKKIIEYQPEKSHYDYLINSPEWQKISNDHYVLANSRELKEYKTILKREK
jgi:oligopeptide transport system ATP-binding protein